MNVNDRGGTEGLLKLFSTDCKAVNFILVIEIFREVWTIIIRSKKKTFFAKEHLRTQTLGHII